MVIVEGVEGGESRGSQSAHINCPSPLKPFGIMIAYLSNAQNLVWIPYLGNYPLRHHDQVDHAAHERPAGNSEQSTLDFALPPPLRRAQ